MAMKSAGIEVDNDFEFGRVSKDGLSYKEKRQSELLDRQIA
jgi:hypothetical protein